MLHWVKSINTQTLLWGVADKVLGLCYEIQINFLFIPSMEPKLVCISQGRYSSPISLFLYSYKAGTDIWIQWNNLIRIWILVTGITFPSNKSIEHINCLTNCTERLMITAMQLLSLLWKPDFHYSVHNSPLLNPLQNLFLKDHLQCYHLSAGCLKWKGFLTYVPGRSLQVENMK
jgi:hypothetical protein